jgi:prephenate dehydrogenase
MAVHHIFADIAPALRSEAVVTDVSSTKAVVCDWAAELLGPQFVGGHPMAGSERGGIAQARADLFDGAVYCLTPDQATAPDALAAVTGMVDKVGARPRLIDASTHDHVLAAISHLPFLLSTALVEVTASDPRWDLLSEIAATGFRDVSRLASGDVHMHRDICLTNSAAIRPWLQAAIRALQSFADDLDDSAALFERFERAKSSRDQLIRKKLT